jgi:hypothetical protein
MMTLSPSPTPRYKIINNRHIIYDCHHGPIQSIHISVFGILFCSCFFSLVCPQYAGNYDFDEEKTNGGYSDIVPSVPNNNYLTVESDQDAYLTIEDTSRDSYMTITRAST